MALTGYFAAYGDINLVVSCFPSRHMYKVTYHQFYSANAQLSRSSPNRASKIRCSINLFIL